MPTQFARRGAALLVALLGSCAHAPSEVASADVNRAFEAVASRFLQEELALDPVRATQLGDHRRDDRWPEPWPAGERAERELVARTREALSRIDPMALSPSNRVDARILLNELDARTFSLDELREPEHDPVFYTALVGAGLDPLLTRDFAPIEARLSSLAGRLSGLPDVLAAARALLRHAARANTETAIEQARGLVALLERDVPVQAAHVPALEAELRRRAEFAAQATREFTTFLERDLLPRSDGDFRLGRVRFERKFRLFLDTDVSPDDLVRTARALVESTRADLFETARALWPELWPGQAPPGASTAADRSAVVRRVLDAVAQDHSNDATVVDDARALAREATEFVRRHDLVTLPAEPLRVIAVPEYRRGVAVAYCDASGPLERHPETAVAISPTPASWPPGRVESFYREYNRSMLAELIVHEAMPGHFVQIARGRAGSTPARTISSSGTFVEGWATYAESVMARHGYGGLRVRLQREKLLLRAAVNALLDHGVHAASMSRDEAMRLMMHDGMQEEGEAIGKWRRAQLTSTQLSSYALGYVELTALRERAEREPGFTERTYHDRLLSFGALPPRELAVLLFGS